ncbi:SDR family oxidoreductase [Catenuloplanes atrovinosus]|uniref:Nucleoside-diphosphate-sugar epimerase n=1 Tax=Catenuloplanes atrovinosus TaxID=137266 RepID=A0AAE3YRH4_9ACTN|nr:SDR family oxidoreductase [Catenuloplanes atrovinosus]MDR7276999.1 nucleoside-diphosphate-sugar epimerase [Catenuloplanes atrovinosus]
MHVFVTGGTGAIGSAVVAELLGNGHTVLALARSDASARAAERAGAEPLRGGLADLDVLRAGAARAEGVIHLAFHHDFSTAEALAGAVAEESAAIAALGEVLIGSDRPFVTVAGTPVMAGRVSTEDDPASTDGPVGGRGVAVTGALALAARGVRASSVRLPRSVHHGGPGGFAAMLAAVARESGVSGYPGDGEQRWPAVHVLDAAVLFRLALERSPAGRAWHAVADEGDRVRDLATVIGRRLGLPVRPVPAETYGPIGAIMAIDQPSSGVRTREELDWVPKRPSLLDDLERMER